MAGLSTCLEQRLRIQRARYTDVTANARRDPFGVALADNFPMSAKAQTASKNHNASAIPRATKDLMAE
jgi:hypothetical protein